MYHSLFLVRPRNNIILQTFAELYEIINAVCIAAGMDQKKASAMTADIPKLRRMLLALSDKQIAALIGSLGAADRQDIMQRLGS